MKGKILTAILIGAIVTFGLLYLFWPQYDDLPNLGKVEPFQVDSIFSDEYQLDNQRIKLVAFFYTNCPDICPLTMSDFNKLQEELKREELFGNSVQLVAITLDPENDTTSVIKNYASHFDVDPAGWLWLRGTLSQTKQIAEDFQMYYKATEDNFLIHGTTMYLLDQHHNIRAIYDMANRKNPINMEEIVGDMLLLVD
ncbi:SCO family protein [Gracilibacillus xinjiangensis]|uniref:SCO family protein n=1 Tax=Gracilibacillus xinjiangensis TaxID=1193282 RepID=A0ABV8WWH3_9BACI